MKANHLGELDLTPQPGEPRLPVRDLAGIVAALVVLLPTALWFARLWLSLPE
jgi:hypothetical protein